MTAPPARTSSESFIQLNDLIVQPEFESLMCENNLTNLTALFELRENAGDDANKSLSKPGLDRWRERLRVNLRDGDATRVCYLKRYDHAPRHARREIAQSQSGAKSLAGIEWHWLNELKAAGIPCTTPVALGEQFEGSREIHSAILVAEVPGRSLERICADAHAVNRDCIRRLIPPLVSLVARFHAAGFAHRDLYLSHIFYDASSASGESGAIKAAKSSHVDSDHHDDSVLHLIDLHRVRRPQYFRQRWIVKDLAALNYSAPSPLISRTDRLRWLKEYLSVFECPSEVCSAAPRGRRGNVTSPPTRGGATGNRPIGAISSLATEHAHRNPSPFKGEGEGEGQQSVNESGPSKRARKQLNSAARRLTYRVIGKTLSIAHHDAVRRRKLGM